MAKQSIEPNRLYRVQLAHSISVGRQRIAPTESLKLRGDILAAVLSEDPTAVSAWKPDATPE